MIKNLLNDHLAENNMVHDFWLSLGFLIYGSYFNPETALPEPMKGEKMTLKSQITNPKIAHCDLKERKMFLLLVPAGFYIPIICSNKHFNCSDLLDLSLKPLEMY